MAIFWLYIETEQWHHTPESHIIIIIIIITNNNIIGSAFGLDTVF